MIMVAVMAPGVTDFSAFGQRILDMMSKPFAIDGRDIYLPTNVGVTTADKAQDSQELLLEGEHALLEAKREGGGRVCVYSNAIAKTQAPDPVVLPDLALESSAATRGRTAPPECRRTPQTIPPGNVPTCR